MTSLRARILTRSGQRGRAVFIQVSQRPGKSWKTWKMKKYFPDLEKSWNLKEKSQNHGKIMEFKNIHMEKLWKEILRSAHSIHCCWTWIMEKWLESHGKSWNLIPRSVGNPVIAYCYYPLTQNPTSSGWLQSLWLLSRFRTIKKCNEIKYVCLIPSSNDIWHVIKFYLHPTPW